MKQIFGNMIFGDSTPIKELTSRSRNMYDVIIEGTIFDLEVKGPFKNGNYLYTGSIYDGDSSMFYKLFHKNKFDFQDKQFLRMKGSVEFDDRYKHEMVFSIEHLQTGDMAGQKFVDDAPEKRVELNFLSKMSRHYSTMSIEQGIKIAKEMGHKALALTDKEVAQAYPAAFNAAKKEDFKVIYGLTMNMVDDSRPIIFNPSHRRLDEVSYTVWDFETTGFATEDEDIIEFGATRFEPYNGCTCNKCNTFYSLEEEESEFKRELIERNICPSCFGLKLKEYTPLEIQEIMDKDSAVETLYKVTHKAVGQFRELVNTKKLITPFTTELTGITKQEIIRIGKSLKEVLPAFSAFSKDSVLVAHNAPFDMDWLITSYKRLGLPVPHLEVLDTLQLARAHRKDLGKHGLKPLSKAYDVELLSHHRADEDADATGKILVKMIVELLEKNICYLDELNDMRDEDYFKGLFPKEITLWVKTQAGLKNLYRLISLSHTTYLNRGSAIIPKRVVEEHREGLIIGSGGIEGHLFEYALQKMPEQVKEEMAFFDVIELVPIENASHLPRQNTCESMDSVRRAWKTIYNTARELGKTIVATGNAQYAKREQRVAHHALLNNIMSGDYLKKSGHLDDMLGDAHFRSTTEMFEAFDWLPQEEAHEIIVTNTNALADSCDVIEIIPKELFTPKIEGANEELEEMTMNRARELYGDPLPEYIQARLKKELDAILGYGFAVVYLISQKLVKKSEDAGYLVGSRGSVGSSLVATMSGITEVNPLKPHYYCGECKWSAFFDHADIQSGYDLPRSMKVLLTDEKYSEEGRAHFAEVLTESLGAERVNQLKQSHEENECPVCRAKALKYDGQDIPFETFLGFKGDKVPDIDLNFSGVYQNTIHRYVEELFGEQYVFRAGTVGTVADNTAYGYINGYLKDHREGAQKEIDALQEDIKNIKLEEEEYKQATKLHAVMQQLDKSNPLYTHMVITYQMREIEKWYHAVNLHDYVEYSERQITRQHKEMRIQVLEKRIVDLKWSKADISRVSNEIKGVKRTSGQHPGGMLVVPDYKEIYDFTPFQYPANKKYADKEKTIIQQQTSHFDFHAIHDNILKLDILGHVDPTELRVLQDLTGINPKDLPVNDDKILKLFTDPEAAGIPLSRIEAKTGTLGIPEFGTKFVQEMILDTQPTTFAELVKISGLSHGTDVWIGNAKDLITGNICTLKEVIDTRDNIMVGLIQKGLEESLSFTIMESVRKGKGLTPEMEAEMRAKNIEEWYIESCKKIKYMFPKAHASAYVRSATRIAYFKVYHPAAFYTAHLSVRYGDQDITEILNDSETIRLRIRELVKIMQQKENAKPKQTTAKEKGLKDALDLVLEAKERGITFAPPRIYGSHATMYRMDGNTLIAPLQSIPGIGETAAQSLYEEAQKGIFRGIEDLKSRAGVGDAIVDILRHMDCLELIEEKQYTLY